MDFLTDEKSLHYISFNSFFCNFPLHVLFEFHFVFLPGQPNSVIDLGSGAGDLGDMISHPSAAVMGLPDHNDNDLSMLSDESDEDSEEGGSASSRQSQELQHQAEDKDKEEEEDGNEEERKLADLGHHSTTEYLPGMLHSQSPLGLLPQFPEWALLCTGKYNSYSASHGECSRFIVCLKSNRN